ncbi:MAG: exodeoxyribonuclease VII large subunit [Longimicrobiales bacterium]|nr:exodeoxyribonuclease VII large subunit [Longimicrobiales bacterium]
MAVDLSLDLFGGAGEPPDGDVPPPPPPPAPGEPRVWTVSQVNKAVRTLLESAVDALWVAGEVANWTRSRQGHCYFTLKDERAQLRCVLFRADADRLPADPEEGMRVRAYGSLTLYEARGDYQMVVERVEAEGAEGLWRLAFEKLRRKLEEEGLLDPARKRRLPRYPSTVGVVTSPTGAAVRDILTGLRRRAPWVRVLIRGTRVQGEGAALEVARAIAALDASGLCDVLIVGRGGGSVEDLWAFNEEPVARAIAACGTPVVSAVGHEVDVTICDLVADLRAPTPSAAAELVVPDRDSVVEQLSALPARLARGLRGAVELRHLRLERAFNRLARALERRLLAPRQGVDLAAARLERGVTRLLERRREAVAAAAGRLHALSPLAILERGYSVARTLDGRVVRRVEELPAGRTFQLRVMDGTVACESTGPLDGEAS